jgi:hypothetical protein
MIAERVRLRVFGDNAGPQSGLPVGGIREGGGVQGWPQTGLEFDTGRDGLPAYTRSRLHRGQGTCAQ